eukprot:Rmarinus@m.18863
MGVCVLPTYHIASPVGVFHSPPFLTVRPRSALHGFPLCHIHAHSLLLLLLLFGVVTLCSFSDSANLRGSMLFIALYLDVRCLVCGLFCFVLFCFVYLTSFSYHVSINSLPRLSLVTYV